MSDRNGEDQAVEAAFGAAMGRLGPALMAGLDALEQTFRRLHPPDLPRLASALSPVRDRLEASLQHFEAIPAPGNLDDFRVDLLAGSQHVFRALSTLVEPGEQGAMGAFGAMRSHARAQATLYPLRRALPPISAFFAEEFRRGSLDALESPPGASERVGLFRSGEPGARGSFDLYVPEHVDDRVPRPLVVALHGGSGSGEDFIWTWLREARSRGFLLLSPTSRDRTWSLNAPEIDGRALREMTDWVASEWNVDRAHILLTGLSDGATMTLLVGLGEDPPFTHLAPISGVLHPMNFANGNLDRARDRPIYLVHGALDWMFPVTLAQEAARVLRDAGSQLTYRELEDLSHTYPREENVPILEWFDPSLCAERAR